MAITRCTALHPHTHHIILKLSKLHELFGRESEEPLPLGDGSLLDVGDEVDDDSSEGQAAGGRHLPAV